MELQYVLMLEWPELYSRWAINKCTVSSLLILFELLTREGMNFLIQMNKEGYIIDQRRDFHMTPFIMYLDTIIAVVI